MDSKLKILTEEFKTTQFPLLSRSSINWFNKKVAEIKNPTKIIRDIAREKQRTTRVGQIMKGKLYFFFYNPKTRNNLPYYDRFPLVLMLEKYNDGFLGLNLHYLPIRYRVAFLNKLMVFALQDNEDDIRRIRVTYDILTASKRFQEFKPCIKRYLYSHVKSRILAVQPDEWQTAIYLPVHQFKGEKAPVIWKESMEEVRNS
jgi:hypothetical protein